MFFYRNISLFLRSLFLLAWHRSSKDPTNLWAPSGSLTVFSSVKFFSPRQPPWLFCQMSARPVKQRKLLPCVCVVVYGQTQGQGLGLYEFTVPTWLKSQLLPIPPLQRELNSSTGTSRGQPKRAGRVSTAPHKAAPTKLGTKCEGGVGSVWNGPVAPYAPFTGLLKDALPGGRTSTLATEVLASRARFKRAPKNSGIKTNTILRQ